MAYNNKFYLGDYVRVLEITELMDTKSDNKAWINSVNVAGETPLHIAARRRILDLFESMLPFYDDVETCDDQGNTILHRLVDNNVESDEDDKRKRIDLLRTVIAKGADVNRRNKHGSTATHFAATHCHMEMLEILREAGADFSLRTEDGETPLLLACEHMFKVRGTDDEEKVIDFLASDCDVNATDEEGYSALHYAVEFCSSRTVLNLLDAGADANLPTKERQLTPMHLAAERKKPTKIDFLTTYGADVNCEEIDGLTPLHFALLESTPEVVEYLIECGSDLNRPESILQFTPLHVAVYQQLGDLVQLLIDKGANVNGSGADDLAPLHLSSMLGMVEITKTLMDRGADVNCRDENEFTPLHLAIRKNHDVYYDRDDIVGAEAITYEKEKSTIVKLMSCEHCPLDEDYDAIVRLLVDSGADVNAVTKNGESSLQLAVKKNVRNVMKILLDNGADVNYKQPGTELTALHLATRYNYKDAAETLINADADVNALTKDGENCLHLTVGRYESVEMLNLLVKSGIDLNSRESVLGLTALEIAERESFDDAIEVLIDAGVEQNKRAKNVDEESVDLDVDD